MSATAITFQGTTLPDCFVGVPYIVGLPVKLGTSVNVTAVTYSGLPQGLASIAGGAGILSGNVQVTSSVGTQLDGAYPITVTLQGGDGGTTVSAALTMNVHYLTADQDLSVAAQAAIRAGEQIDNTQTEEAGVISNVFPTAPVMPTDVG